ncbi:MAG: S8 family serine peptidase [Candidatus Pacebacteria bacterium]|nr:S8 family serine peptidase [Candidatus Paceibacterota bacterium]
MKKIKIEFIILVLFILTIITGSFLNKNLMLASLDGSKKLKINISLEEVLYKKVIADNISEQDIQNFENRGCEIRYRLKNAVSFKCPRILKPMLFAAKLPVTREVRKFHITDAESNYQIRTENVWQDGLTGKGIKIAILDTGFDFNHPELVNSYIGGYDFINNDNIPEDEHGHGTHVAGIITGNGIDERAKGVAPDAKIYMFKVCDAFGVCPEDAMIAGMEAVIETDAQIMSMSLGGMGTTEDNCDYDFVAKKVNEIADHAIIPVIAAGNCKWGKLVDTPGCASKAIAVGAVDKNDNVAGFSGRGKALDILAPGVSIYSSIVDGYDSWDGTSMATPHVSAAIALLLEYNTSLTDPEIREILYNTTSPVDKCYETSFFGPKEVDCINEIVGTGILNIYHGYLAGKCNCL